MIDAIEKKLTKFVLRPSSASRWLSCNGSALLEHGKSETRALDFMIKTTRCSAAHYLLERCVTESISPSDLIGTDIEVNEDTMDFPVHHIVDHEMAGGVQMFLDHTNKNSSGETSASELFMQHSQIPELHGTADYVAVNGMFGFLDDLKFGVSAVAAQSRNGEKNKQLLCYATLMFDRFPSLVIIEASIIQPRLKTKVKIRSVTFTRGECKEFEAKVASIAAKLHEPPRQLPLLEGSYCYFCKARSSCPKVNQTRLESDFGGLEVDP